MFFSWVRSSESLKKAIPKLVPIAILPSGKGITFVTKLSGRPSFVVKLLKILFLANSLPFILNDFPSNFFILSALSKLKPPSVPNQRFPALSSVMFTTKLLARPCAFVKFVKDVPS